MCFYTVLYNEFPSDVSGVTEFGSGGYSNIHPEDWRSGGRIPVEVRFSVSVKTGLGSHPASCTMGTGSFPGVKRPGRGVYLLPASIADVRGML